MGRDWENTRIRNNRDGTITIDFDGERVDINIEECLEAQAYMDKHIKPILKACARDRAQLVHTLQEARAFIVDGHIELAIHEIDTTLAYYTPSAILKESEL